MSLDLTRNLVQQWWNAIDRAAFDEAAALLADDAVVDWPLSNERMPSPAAWRDVNAAYPGRWQARIEHMVIDDTQAMTITRVFDPGIDVIAISHFTISEGRITNLLEYWPEAYAAPEWRSKFTVPLSAARINEMDPVR